MGFRTMCKEWETIETSEAQIQLRVLQRILQNADVLSMFHRQYKACGYMIRRAVRTQMKAWVEGTLLHATADADVPDEEVGQIFCETLGKLRHLSRAPDADVRQWADVSRFLYDEDMLRLIRTFLARLDAQTKQCVIASCHACVQDCNRRGIPC